MSIITRSLWSYLEGLFAMSVRLCRHFASCLVPYPLKNVMPNIFYRRSKCDSNIKSFIFNIMCIFNIIILMTREDARVGRSLTPEPCVGWLQAQASNLKARQRCQTHETFTRSFLIDKPWCQNIEKGHRIITFSGCPKFESHLMGVISKLCLANIPRFIVWRAPVLNNYFLVFKGVPVVVTT